jgi:anti-sigma factor RsiW
MKAHRKYIKLINLKLDGLLPPEDENHLKQHLNECRACRDEYEILAGIRRNLLSVADIPVDTATAERRKTLIMDAVQERHAKSHVQVKKPAVLRPAIVLASIIAICAVSLSILHKPGHVGPELFSNPQDAVLDRMLVSTLNEHELVGIIEVFNDPALVATEISINGSHMMEQLK